MAQSTSFIYACATTPHIPAFRPKHGRPIKLYSSPVALNCWKRLSIPDKLKRCLIELQRSDSSADVTIRVGRDQLTKSHKSPRGPVDYFARRLTYHLEKALGRHVEFMLVGESTITEDFHLHGVMGLLPVEYEKARKAIRRAVGNWPIGARQWQIQIRPNPDAGWVTYITKRIRKFDGQAYTITKDLRGRAMAGHHDHLVAVRKLRASRTAPVTEATGGSPAGLTPSGVSPS